MLLLKDTTTGSQRKNRNCFNAIHKEEKTEGSLTVNMGKNVAFNSLKILIGESRRRNPTTV